MTAVVEELFRRKISALVDVEPVVNVRAICVYVVPSLDDLVVTSGLPWFLTPRNTVSDPLAARTQTRTV